MRPRSSHPDRIDLSRIVRALGGEVRRHLDTTRGFPTHHRVTAALARRIRRRLSHPDPRVRAKALDLLRRRILGRAPSPPNWSQTVKL